MQIQIDGNSKEAWSSLSLVAVCDRTNVAFIITGLFYIKKGIAMRATLCRDKRIPWLEKRANKTEQSHGKRNGRTRQNKVGFFT
ncbi:hypothetical protein SADUNF_Sadunf06G0019300 [Salix dunnii]|uniref:Uncharacterized protein n=1 Tax=Salix dunnii TaxID=1413687 RepID=A0A835K2M9_9ROSI|nr:hypothetical protein SADUNF_Sadunf06G0019300 [Salix dunnii]